MRSSRTARCAARVEEIRDRLGLDAGAMLDFQVLPDNTITARAVKPDARRIPDVCAELDRMAQRETA